MIRRHGVGLDGLNVERRVGDIGKPETLVPAFEGSDVVFHTAARISITRADAGDVAEANVGGTRNVIAACRKAGVRRLVYFSSIEALEPRPLDIAVDEDRPFVNGRAGSPYAATKAQAETEVRRAMAEGLDAVILNPTAIIGPFDFKPSLLGRAILAWAEGRFPILIEGGFDWVDVRDVAEAAIAAAERAASGSRYIVGGRWASMAELAQLASDAAGSRAPRLMCPLWIARAGAPFSSAFCRLTGRTPLFTGYTLKVLQGNRNVSHERARRELGHAPRALRDTVRDTCMWFREQGLLS